MSIQLWFKLYLHLNFTNFVEFLKITKFHFNFPFIENILTLVLYRNIQIKISIHRKLHIFPNSIFCVVKWFFHRWRKTIGLGNQENSLKRTQKVIVAGLTRGQQASFEEGGKNALMLECNNRNSSNFIGSTIFILLQLLLHLFLMSYKFQTNRDLLRTWVTSWILVSLV